MPRSNARTAQKGFSLVEVMLALGLSAAILGAIYSTLYAGTRGWKRMRQRAELFQVGRVVLDRIEDDVQHALPLTQGAWKKRVLIKGSASALALPTMLSIADPNATSAPFVWPAVGMVSYSWSTPADGAPPVLERTWQAWVPEDNPEVPTSGQDVFPNVIANVSFSYPYRNEHGDYPSIIWDDQWRQPMRIPKGVRVEILLKQPDTGEQVTLSKTISIPQGLLGDSHWIAHAKN